MTRGPDFIIIGAMKCATTTLHGHLERLPGVFMANPKETSFFSDDDVYQKGIGWYRSLFDAASPADIRGESSTHYTKLPTHPKTVERMRKHLERVKLIYVMRHPVDRLVSQYIHEWSQREVSVPIDEAVQKHPRLAAYSQYAMQVEPFLQAYGSAQVLPVFFERLVSQPQSELERICGFIGYPGVVPRLDSEDGWANKSSQRVRKGFVRDLLMSRPLTNLRRRIIPQSVRDRFKRLFQVKQRPELSPRRAKELEAAFNEDLKRLGRWLGREIDCDNFKSVALQGPHEFRYDQ